MNVAVRFDQVSVTYAGAPGPVLDRVDLELAEGDLVLVIGRTGSGKSTLLGAVDGLVPHFTGGLLEGRVEVHGHDTARYAPRDLADLVGVVGQDPLAGFVTDTVEEELAYGMEQIGLAPATMRRRVEETLDLLGIADLRRVPLRRLSGGQQQRVAIGSVMTTHPRVLVLDEPTSALDPTSAEEVLAAVTRLAHDLAVTVVMAEHRLERVLQYADTVVHVADGRVRAGTAEEVMGFSQIAPPVVELGRLAGWQPVPTSVRTAYRLAGDLRAKLGEAPVVGAPGGAIGGEGVRAVALAASRLVVRHGDVVAVDEVTLDLRAGEVAALMGRNGSGKSSLLWALQGSGPRAGGSVGGPAGDPRDLPPGERRAAVSLVPQTPGDLLYLTSVGEECAQADRESGAAPGTARGLLDRLAAGVADGTHPRDLSEGQRLALVLAVQLTASPRVVLLDEPTRGLDYPGKAALANLLRDLAAHGTAVLLSTHDVEFVAEATDRVLVLATGQLVADGGTTEAVTSSPTYAPQVAKVLRGRWLHVEQVREALA